MSVIVAKPAIDAAMAGARIRLTLGPLAVPSIDAMRSAFRSLAEAGNPVRLAYRSHQSGGWEWIADTIGSRLGEIVRQAPDGAAGEAVEAWLADNLVSDLPVQVALGDACVSISIDHTLVDARVALAIPVLLMDAAHGRDTSEDLTVSARAPLVRALLSTFGAKPAAWRALVRDVRRHRDKQQGMAVPPQRASGQKVPVAAGSLTAHVFGSFDHATMGAVRHWGRERGITAAPTLLYLVSRALQESGIETTGEGYLLVDLRRYLPPSVATTGNFISSLPVRVRDPRVSPDDLGVDVQAGLSSGRPLASAATRLTSRRLRPQAPVPDGLHIDAPTHARLSMSNVSSLPGWDRLPWTGDPGSRDIRISTDAAEPGTIGWVVASSGGRTYFSATYRADVFSRDRMADAMAAATGRPLEILDAT